jgi:RNA polymerase primary sigma factor
LVISIAKKYLNRGLDYEDLISYGIIGLINAIDRFKPDLGNRLSTHATWWIRQAITRAIADFSKTIRISTSASQRINTITKVKRTLENTLMRDPTPEEIAKELGWDVNKVVDTLRQGAPVLSYDRPIDDENKNDMMAIINVEGTPIYDEDMETADLFNSFIKLAKKYLTEKELYVLCARNGIGCEKQTLESIGKKLGVTKQNIGQIQQNAARKLRSREDILRFMAALSS